MMMSKVLNKGMTILGIVTAIIIVICLVLVMNAIVIAFFAGQWYENHLVILGSLIASVFWVMALFAFIIYAIIS